MWTTNAPPSFALLVVVATVIINGANSAQTTNAQAAGNLDTVGGLWFFDLLSFAATIPKREFLAAPARVVCGENSIGVELRNSEGREGRLYASRTRSTDCARLYTAVCARACFTYN